MVVDCIPQSFVQLDVYCHATYTNSSVGQKIIEELDLGFVVSAAAIDAEETFEKIKKSLQLIVDTYGTGSIRYGIILFGSIPVVSKGFGKRYQDDNALKIAIRSFQRPSGEPNLEQALRKAKMMFDALASRPKAKKVNVHNASI